MNGASQNIKRCWLIFVLAALMSFSFTAQAEVNQIWTVSAPVANVRAEPSGGAGLVTQLSAGEQVVEIEREGAWLQVRLPDERLAWMHQVTLTQRLQLFGLSLEVASRAELRAALQEAGVRVVREIDAYPYDLYDPSGWMTGATEMAVGYTLEDQLFAVAEITFRSRNDTEQVRQIAEQVRDQLGPWQRVMGRRSEGPVEFEWRRGDIQVLVHRGWPDTTTYLTYEMPERMQQLQQGLQTR